MRLVVAAVDGEVEVGPLTHVGDVRERLPTSQCRADAKPRPKPDVPVLGDHDPLAGRVLDEHAAAEGRVDEVADDDAVAGGHHRLDAGLDVSAGVQPDGAGRAGAQHRSVADAPLAAEGEAVRLPGGQRVLEEVRRVHRRSGLRRRLLNGLRSGRARYEDRPHGAKDHEVAQNHEPWSLEEAQKRLNVDSRYICMIYLTAIWSLAQPPTSSSACLPWARTPATTSNSWRTCRRATSGRRATGRSIP